MLLLYRKNSQNLDNFYEYLLQVTALQSFDIILGDFNINALEKNTQIFQILSNYIQVVTEPTQISGALLDHVFIRKQIMQDFDVQNIVITTHFSDHDAVFLKFKLKDTHGDGD